MPAFPLVALLFSACATQEPADSAEPTPTSTAPGTLHLSFRMDADLIASMDEPPAGSFFGALYADADATAEGPVDGAAPLLDLEVPGLDLTAGGGPSPVTWDSEPLAPQDVWILGCLDS